MSLAAVSSPRARLPKRMTFSGSIASTSASTTCWRSLSEAVDGSNSLSPSGGYTQRTLHRRSRSRGPRGASVRARPERPRPVLRPETDPGSRFLAMGSRWPLPVSILGRMRRRSVRFGRSPTRPSLLPDSCSTTRVRHRTALGTAFRGGICSRIRPGRTATVSYCDGRIRHRIAPATDWCPVTRAPAGASRDAVHPASRKAMVKYLQ